MQPEFRYDTSGRWYKGNTHVHSTVSDGGKTPAELAELYAAEGYHFLCRTDHWQASDIGADRDEYPLLWLDGVELDGRDETGAMYHAVGLGRFQGLERSMGLVAGMDAVRSQGGLLILAHPHWCGNTFDDALRHPFDGVEIYNHVCTWLNGKGDSLPYWNAMLGRAPGALSFACDDAHLRPEHPTWNGGWIVVNASALERGAILNAILRGNYYSSCGPSFDSIRLAGDQVVATTSPVRYARLVGPASIGLRMAASEVEALTEVSFPLPDWPYAYLEIEDERGRRAWTNTLMRAATAGAEIPDI